MFVDCMMRFVEYSKEELREFMFMDERCIFNDLHVYHDYYLNSSCSYELIIYGSILDDYYMMF